ncbi:hypothetical protein GCM10022226_57930 [Sphaerisporangium flaviroseum]|uniref:Signal transduction histidine-protein kinase/phosphatase MprB n=1 Tax=Sphaerisporangium flaviroseum TaxID=509199 RepID=A0ABP7IYP3_9ACTN
MRPLDFLGRIKIKLGLVILLAVATAFAINEYGRSLGVVASVRMGLAALLSVGMVQLIGRGMTRPLREMAAAAQTIAKGRYGMRVRATSRDEVGELARAFNAMAADLEEVDRQRRELVANVSHELRTPITGLQAVLENVVDGVSPPDLATLSTALAQTERLGRLVAQLLDLSRLDSGARPIEPEPVELVALCGQAVREASLARDDVSLSSAVSPRLGVRADPALLGQVLANLLDNGVRHSPPGGLVRLEARPEGAGVRLSVTDEGPGIPEPERPRVFERFSRLDTARAADAGGAGLGLAIVKEIVELHGGSIRVAESPVGCRMVVDLPERTTIMSDVPDQESPGEKASATPTGDRAGLAGDRVGHSGKAATVAGRADDVRAPVDAVAKPVDAAGTPADVVGGPAYATRTPAPTAPPADRVGTPVHAEGPPVPPGTPVTGTPVPGTPVTGTPVTGTQVPGTPVNAGAAVHAGGAQADAGTPIHPGGVPVHAGGVPDAGGVPVDAGSAPAYAGGAGGAPAYAGGVPVDAGSAPAYAGAPAHARSVPVQGLGSGLTGGLLGLVCGFVSGLCAAFFVGFFLGGPYSLAVLLLFTVGGTLLGSSLGAASARSHTAPLPEPALAGRGVYPPPADYVPPPLFPRPVLPKTPRGLLVLAAAVGLIAAVALPDARPGLGIVLVAVATGAAVLPAARRRITPWTAVLGLLAYALVAVALFRDAEWLVPPMLLAGFGLAALAVSGAGSGWLGVIRGGLSVILALPPLPWFLLVPLKKLKDRWRIGSVLAALGLTTVLIVVFGTLFVSADAVFSSLVARLFTAPGWVSSLPSRLFVFVAFATLVGAATLVALRPVVEPATPGMRARVSSTLWITPLVALNLLFVFFVVVQTATLFGGNRKVVETAGLTYAEYARSGFFELVTVSVFVLAIVAVAVAVLAPGRTERWLLAGLLGLLCALTLVILASALHRLGLYIDAYGLSRMRASVEAAIWWLAAVFAMVLVAGGLRLAGQRTSWLPRTLVALTGLSLVVFAVWNPDLRVAETQLQVRGVGRVDVDYLSDLGAEAVPAVDGLAEPWRSCLLDRMSVVGRLGGSESWNGWNLAREHARDLLRVRPLRQQSPLGCEDIGSPGT